MNFVRVLESEYCLRLTVTLAHFLWQGAIIALLALVGSLLLRHKRATTRYAVFLVLFLLMAICPIVTFLHLSRGEPAASPQNIVVGERTAVVLSPEAVREPMHGLSAMQPPLPAPIAQDIEQSWNWLWICPYAAVAYLAGVLVMFVRLLVGLYGGQTLRRRSEPVDDAAILSALAHQAKRLHLAFTPAIAFCRDVMIPTVVGVLRPMILLPITLASGLAPEQIEVLIAHELAHLRRYDHLVNILQRIIEAFLFFHPATWYLSRLIRVERENCCDDLVVAAGGKPTLYAASLVQIAEMCVSNRSAWRGNVAALGATGKPSHLRHRVLRLLGTPTHEQVRLNRAWIMILGLSLVVSTAFFVSSARSDDSGHKESPSVVSSDTKDEKITRVGNLDRGNSLKTGESIPLDYFVGQVVNAEGKPIAGATAILYPRYYPMNKEIMGGSDIPVLTADDNGVFRWRWFGERWSPERRYYTYLEVSAPGYASVAVTDIPVGKSFTVTLTKNTRFKGAFVRPDGTPTGPTTVTLVYAKPTTRPLMGGTISDIHLERKTNDKGEFDFPVEPGTYEIRVASQSGFFARYTQRIESGQVVTLPAKLGPGVRFEAKVIDSQTGQPVVGEKIAIRHTAQPEMCAPLPESERTTNKEGIVVWDALMPGMTRFNFDRDQPYRRWWSRESKNQQSDKLKESASVQDRFRSGVADLLFDLRPGMAPVVITMEKGVRLSGQVLSPDGKPVDSAVVTDSTPTASGILGYGGRYVAFADDGRFDGYAPAGRGIPFHLCAWDRKHRWAGVCSEAFVSKPGDRLTFTLRMTEGGWIYGRVIGPNGQPVADLELVAVNQDNLDSVGGYPRATTDEDGRFVITHIRPGNIRVEFARVHSFAYQGIKSPQITTQVVEGKGNEVEMSVSKESLDAFGIKIPAPSTQPAASADIFGPVVEHVIYDRASGKEGWLSFETGKLLPGPNGPGASDPWLQSNSIDLAGMASAGYQGFIVFDTVIFRIEDERWNTMTLASFRRELPAKGFVLHAATMMSPQKPLPETYIFRTRKGLIGMLQLVEANTATKPASITIRYKLLRPEFYDQAQSSDKPWPKVLRASDLRRESEQLQTQPASEIRRQMQDSLWKDGNQPRYNLPVSKGKASSVTEKTDKSEHSHLDSRQISARMTILSVPAKADLSFFEKPKAPDGIKSPARVVSQKEADQFLSQIKKINGAEAISSPQVLVLEHQTGLIRIGNEIPISLPITNQPSAQKMFQFPVGIEVSFKADIVRNGGTNVDLKYARTLLAKTDSVLRFLEVSSALNVDVPVSKVLLVQMPHTGRKIRLVSAQDHVDTATGSSNVEFEKETIDGKIDTKDTVFILVKLAIIPKPAPVRPATQPATGSTSPERFVFVTGLPRPGVFRLPEDRRLTLRQILASAGGIPEDRKSGSVRLLRPDQQGRFTPVATVAIQDFSTGEEAQTIVQAGDIVWVTGEKASPSSSNTSDADGKVLVVGDVLKPGTFSMKSSPTLTQVLIAAGFNPDKDVESTVSWYVQDEDGTLRAKMEGLKPIDLFRGRIPDVRLTPGSVVYVLRKSTSASITPGTQGGEMAVVAVKVVDEDGKPVAGAVITPDGLRVKIEMGNHYGWPGDRPSAKTDVNGVAQVPYPRYSDDKLETGAISFSVDHPDFCPERPTSFRIDGSEAPVVLKRGATLQVSGYIRAEKRPLRNVYPQVSSEGMRLDERSWTTLANGTMVTHRIATGPHYLRLAFRPDKGVVHFSDTVLINAEKGKTYKYDFELKPGVRLEGKLGPEVPLPVFGGRVIALSRPSDQKFEEPYRAVGGYMSWQTSRDIRLDGSFVFDSLPPGTVEIIAVCDGYISRNPPADGPDNGSSIEPQIVLAQGKLQTIQVPMEPLAVCKVVVRDESDRPIPNAVIQFFPNADWYHLEGFGHGLGMFRQSLAHSNPRAEDALRSRETRADKNKRSPASDQSLYEAKTDEQGVAVIRNLPGRRDSVYVSHAQYEQVPSVAQPSRLPSRSLHQSLIVNLSPGKTTEVAVVMRPKKSSPPAPATQPIQDVTPASSQKATHPQRDVNVTVDRIFFVRLAVGKNTLTFGGEEIRWSDLPDRVAKLPGGVHWTVELAAADDHVTQQDIQAAQKKVISYMDSQKGALKIKGMIIGGIGPQKSFGSHPAFYATGPVQFGQEMIVDLQACAWATPEEMKSPGPAVEITSIKFMRDGDSAVATCSGTCLSQPRTEWWTSLTVVDNSLQTINDSRDASYVIFSPGAILGVPKAVKWTHTFNLGPWNKLSGAKKFYLHVNRKEIGKNARFDLTTRPAIQTSVMTGTITKTGTFTTQSP